jgi:hypothetical protein
MSTSLNNTSNSFTNSAANQSSEKDETLYQALERIQQEWGLSDEQIAALAHVDVGTYSRWMIEGRKAINPPTIPTGMDTAVPIVSIYKSLVRRFSSGEDQVKWLFSENSDFGGHKPIDIAASSVENLYWISYYLDSSKS